MSEAEIEDENQKRKENKVSGRIPVVWNFQKRVDDQTSIVEI